MTGSRAAAPVVVHTRAALAAALTALDAASGGAPRRFVPTMGALHAGHAALLDAAGPGAVLSVFVNPLQFGAGEDLDRYPRTLDADVALAAAHGAALVWAPSVADVYPAGPPQVALHAGAAGAGFEGAIRPGHFDGMLAVVAKLFGLVRPHRAYFGRKDAQQLALVRALVRDLELAVDIVAVDTVREADGLALSSRNRYLTAAERRTAAALPLALAAAHQAAAHQAAAHQAVAHQAVAHRAAAAPRDAGARGAGPTGVPAAVVERAARDVLAGAGLRADYCALVDPETFAARDRCPGLLVLAARVGGTRLIDNAVVGDPAVPGLPVPAGAAPVGTPSGPPGG